jgi:mRNA interferase RelE/StbE
MTPAFDLTGYKVVFTKSAQKALSALEKYRSGMIIKKLGLLAAGNNNLDVKKLENRAVPTYRLRCGDFRVIYELNHGQLIILVIQVGHRREVYRND